MSAILFFLSLPFLLLASVLPFRILYLISDILFPLVYYVAAYRKKVVMENLENAFPEKTQKERIMIARKFYRHFVDVILETIKMRTIPPARLRKRIRYSNPELLERYYAENKGVFVMSAHYNNWEWTVGCSKHAPYHPVVVYKPLKNKYFDRFMKRARERHGSEMITMRETLPRVLSDLREGNPALYGLISDQSPVWEHVRYWSYFMNQITPFYTGTEKLALKTGLPVVYYSMRKTGRGRYIIDLIPLSEYHGGLKKNEITERFVRTMEEKVKVNPEYWLWTHRRWKLSSRKMAEMEKH